MKKKAVLLLLLVLPLTLYVYFSLAKHNSLFLPVITKEVNEIPEGKTLDGKAISLKDKISIVGFLGSDLLKRKESIFNINQKINNKYKDFDDFQIVMLIPKGTEEDVKNTIVNLKVMSDISNWKFTFLDAPQIMQFHQSLQVKEPLDSDLGSNNLYIIDKERGLRGRKGKNKKNEDEYKDGYNAFSASELHNEMTDDVKILLREYRLALKKNDSTRVKRKI